jgi:glycosyltransferase involved in cell wall biosynthesis
MTRALETAFWLSFAVIAYTYAGYPLIMYLLARFVPRPWRRAEFTGTVSIIMAVHNAASKVRAQVDHLVTIAPERVREIIVVTDGCTDGTAAALEEIDNSRLYTLVLPEQRGKASALNHGISASTGDVLLFMDIRPKAAPGAVEQLLSNFADPAVGCVAGELVLSSVGHDAASSAVSGVYWRYEQWIRSCEATYDSPVGVYGGFYAARRSLITQFPAGIILDDMFQPLSILRKGYRSVLDRSAIVNDIWPGKVAGEFARKVRTLAGNYQLISLAPWTLGFQNRVLFQLISHKLLRLVVPYFFALMLVSATVLALHSTFWMGVAAAQLLLWLSALASLKVHLPVIHRFAAAAGAMLVLNVAAVAGLFRFVFTRGPLWKTWSPTETSTPSASNSRSRV